MRVGIIIPALNEQDAIGAVISGCLEHCTDLGETRVIVCDNGSTDNTVAVATAAGAEVVYEPRRGYGAACLRALAFLGHWADVIVFVDGDGSSSPVDIASVAGPVLRKEVDLVIGRRAHVEPGSLTLPQRFGNRLACALIRRRWRRHYADCGPLRAIGRNALQRLSMSDQSWGWNVEMQIKAHCCGLAIREVPVAWLRRAAGKSKISGTISGVLRAGARILWTWSKLALCRDHADPPRAVVIAFVKYPRAGEVKTRLARVIGPQQAALVYQQLAEASHRELLRLQRDGAVSAALAVTGAPVDKFRQWLPKATYYWPQVGADLGARLKAALARAFEYSVEQVAVMGSDCPELSAQTIREALSRLHDADVVIVPATDGGYALLAVSRLYVGLFDGIDWSTDMVLAQTLTRAEALNLKVVQLPALSDIDTIDDLDQHQNYLPDKKVEPALEARN